MVDALLHNKMTIAGLAVIIAIAVWYGLSNSGEVQDRLVTETFSSPTSEAERDLVATLSQLRTLTLDGTVFSDPAFQSLRDFGSQIVSEPVGRANPFAPLSSTSSSTASTTPQQDISTPRGNR